MSKTPGSAWYSPPRTKRGQNWLVHLKRKSLWNRDFIIKIVLKCVKDMVMQVTEESPWVDIFYKGTLNLDSKQRALGKYFKEKHNCPWKKAKKTLMTIRCFWYLPSCQGKKLNTFKEFSKTCFWNVSITNRNLFIFIQRKLHIAIMNISTAGKISRCWMFSQSF